MLLSEFREFLKEYKVLSLAIAFIMGSAATTLVSSLVKDVLMPLLTPLLSAGEWKTAVLELGPVRIAIGSFIGELLNFAFLAAVVFLVTKKLMSSGKK